MANEKLSLEGALSSPEKGQAGRGERLELPGTEIVPVAQEPVINGRVVYSNLDREEDEEERKSMTVRILKTDFYRLDNVSHHTKKKKQKLLDMAIKRFLDSIGA